MISDGVLTIEDYSKLQILRPYKSWGEKKSGVKKQFSKGYKRISDE
jgi:hypothetical protein